MAELPASIGRYEIVSRLGQGGMGSLFLAKDPKIGRLIAIKLVRQEFDSPDARTRFAREAQSAGTLRHTNIVTIFDVDEHDGLPFIAMEYIDGETLAEIVRRKAPVEIVKRLQWIEDLCTGLSYAHRQGVIHRDIKPANLMVDTEGTLKILDFGLARRDTSTFTQTQTLIGTPNYMSPEQIKGGDIDHRSDIFSVGAVLYELIAYAPAFPGAVHQAMHKIVNEAPTPVETVVQGLDPRVAAIIHRALEKDVARRYADLTLMKGDLAAARQPTGELQPDTIKISRPAGANRSGRFSTESLQRRRAELIDKNLEDARAKFEAGQIEKARAACEEALFIDPHFPAATSLMSDIAAEVEKRQVAIWLSDARMALAKGQLEVATARVNEAMAVRATDPDVILMLDAIETASREQARARQIQDGLKRARSQFSEGAFESVVRVAAEVLALDSGNPSAIELQSKAMEQIEVIRLKTEQDQLAQDVLADARALVEDGQHAAAIEKLAAFPHDHESVAALLSSLRAEAARAETARAEAARADAARLEAARADAARADAARAEATRAEAVRAEAARAEAVRAEAIRAEAARAEAARTEVARVEAARTEVSRAPAPVEVSAPPVRKRPDVVRPPASTAGSSGRPMIMAAAVLIAVVSGAAYMMRGSVTQSVTPPSQPPTTTPTPPPAPGGTDPGDRPPVPTSRPTDDAVRVQNDDDSAEANRLIMKNDIAGATAILGRIRQRDPNYEGIKTIEDAIALAVKYEQNEAAKKKKTPGNE